MKLFFTNFYYKSNFAELSFFEKILRLFLSVFSLFYGAGVGVKNFLYDRNILKSKKVKSPEVQPFIISIGNLTVGGTGKTPLTALLANYFTSQNIKTAVVSRGYGGKLPKNTVNTVSDGQNILYNALQCGDEAYWMAKNTNNTIVLTSVNRTKGCEFAFERYGVQKILLDDGFGRRDLYRDLNILVVDARKRFGNNLLFPAGPLRESVSQIKRADKIIVMNKSADIESGEPAKQFAKEIERKFKKPVFVCSAVIDSIYSLRTGESFDETGVKFIAFSAIADTRTFYESLAVDFELMTMDFADHHIYTNEDLRKISLFGEQNLVNRFITTEKDAVKLQELYGISDMDILVAKQKLDLNIEEFLR